MKHSPLLAAGAALLLFSCNNAADRKAEEAREAKGDIVRRNMDSTANPADDFFEYANGGWIKANPIPGDETSWGIGQLVNEELYGRKRKINEDAAAEKNPKGVTKQIADFWTVAMDSAKAEQQGAQPLATNLRAIENAQTLPQLMSVAADLHRVGVGVFFSEGVWQDAKNSEVMSYNLSQGGIGLPNRDYYFNNDARTAKIRSAYPGFVATIFSLLNPADSMASRSRADAVIVLETRLAKASRKLEDLRDPYANYNKMTVAELQRTAPSIDWSSVFGGIGVKKIDTVIVGQPEFYKELDAVVTGTPLPVLKDYLRFHLTRAFASYLSKPFADASFNFYSKTIRGAESQRPRWKRALDAQEGAMGEALGKLFAEEYFDKIAKKRYSDMVEAIRDAYHARIEKLDWMSDSTKQKAYTKLATMKKKVGYPDKWKDYSDMKIETKSWAENMMEANRWENDRQIAKLGKPVDHDEWDMTPQTYNAYYNPSNNEIVLPAGIFTVPGYRDEELDDALVYGYAAASTIGHEITHGFDDEGRQFDEKGNLKSWWTAQDEAQFKQRAEVLVRQFNGIVAVDTAHINGRASLGENLADLGGVLLGVDAFKKTDAYKKNETISGLKPMQRFFLGYALGWLYSINESTLASQILTDVHAPAKWRVNGIFPNVPAFYEAFNIRPGSNMYLPDSARVRLW